MISVIISPYLNSPEKKILDLLLVGMIFLLIWPMLIVIAIFVWATDGMPIIFRQKRVGFNGKKFDIFKFRTMQKGADEIQEKYKALNEVDGPVFKIWNDPRYVGLAKWLAWSGLDELPQLLNVLLGQMSMVGPRPLPLREWQRMSGKYQNRIMVLPGITSLWVVEGAHRLTFVKWMKLDDWYLENATLWLDLKIISKTIAIPIRSFLGLTVKRNKWVGVVNEEN